MPVSVPVKNSLSSSEAWIFDLQGFCLHDGPGTRTNVFLMGCPLECGWCSNPEGRFPGPHLMFKKQRCRFFEWGCTRCKTACPRQAISGDMHIDRDLCLTCHAGFPCTKACMSEALVVCGRRLSLDELDRILARDRRFWGAKGGVTFSGGEPLVQADFLRAALSRCREAHIHTAIETAACAESEATLQILSSVDFAFIDLKILDPIAHKRLTGIDIGGILENIRLLAASKWQGRAVFRIPLIAGVNDSLDNIIETARFIKDTGFDELNLLPFHALGSSKWEQCGLAFPFSHGRPPSAAHLATLASQARQAGVRCYIGHETPF
ncbi:MAG: glycyl-radical enzyme activating protein [Candidatus Ozemobacteraceae bacterium]